MVPGEYLFENSALICDVCWGTHKVDDNFMFDNSGIQCCGTVFSGCRCTGNPQSCPSIAGSVEHQRGDGIVACSRKTKKRGKGHPPHVVISHSVISPVIESEEDWTGRLGVQRTTGHQLTVSRGQGTLKVLTDFLGLPS